MKSTTTKVKLIIVDRPFDSFLLFAKGITFAGETMQLNGLFQFYSALASHVWLSPHVS